MNKKIADLVAFHDEGVRFLNYLPELFKDKESLNKSVGAMYEYRIHI